MSEKRKPFQLSDGAKTVKGWVLFFAGLSVMAFGVAFSIRADLGTSPISSLPYTISVITPLTVGTATIVLHCVLIALQILLLRRKYELFQLLQLPVAIAFGYLTDVSIAVVSRIPLTGYAGQLLLCAVGIVLVGIGVWMEVHSHVITLAGEGLVLAVCRVTPIRFSTAKILFDVSLVVLSCILGLVFTGKICGVREGTAAAALCVGLVTKLIDRIVGKKK